MNRFLLFAVGVAMILGLAFSPQPTNAQVFGEYGKTIVLKNVPYQELTSPTVLGPARFALPPTFPVTVAGAGQDDGYCLVPIGFNYEYNGEIYDKVWICVNGFIMLAGKDENGNYINPPSTLLPKNGLANYAAWFFNYSESFPMNIIAPYMGDHRYRSPDDPPRTNGDKYVTSEISYKTQDSIFTVQWKNLNINYDDPLDPDERVGLTRSVGNFQVKLYQSKDKYSKQGDIEFCYGTVGGNNQTNDTRIVTRGAAVGLKGNSEMSNIKADFLNGLYNIKPWVADDSTRYDADQARLVETVTDAWQPSGGTDYRIHFYALGRNQKTEFWGDGDVNMSSLEGQKHAGMGQNRYVTIGDALKILRSIVLNQPLPKERRREAYHGDVNHNGRWFYFTDNNYWSVTRGAYIDTVFREDIPWKNLTIDDSLSYIKHGIWDPLNLRFVETVVPSNIKSIAQVYYQVSEYDAALIVHYIGGRLPYLPWLLDTIPEYGKISSDLLATGLVAGNAKNIGENTYSIPVYLNGANHGPIAIKANSSADVQTISTFSSDVAQITSDFSSNTVVLAGSGDIYSDQPIMNVIVKTNQNSVTLSDIRFNDNEIAPLTINVINDNAKPSMVYPNPFSTNTNIIFNINQTGNYTLKVYDILGNCVKTLVNGELNAGTIVKTWNGTDENGNALNTGTYIYRLNGENTSISEKIVLTK